MTDRYPAMVGAVAFALSLTGCPGHATFNADCTMDSRGGGRCDVTNTGGTTGNHCFRVRVSLRNSPDRTPLTSGLFCSGQVPPKGSTRVPFVVPGVHDYCASPGGDGGADAPWHVACDFTVIDQAPPRPAGS